MSEPPARERAAMGRAEYLSEMQSRHEAFWGAEGRQRLEQTTVGFGGIGGVGALALELLARAGVGTFRLLDGDVYEPSNLNRQVFAAADTLGRPKAEVGRERILGINPYARVEAVLVGRATRQLVDTLFDGVDIAVMATDSPGSEVLFQAAAERRGLPLVCGHTARCTGGVVWLMDHAHPGQRGPGRPTGIPFVDARLRRLTRGDVRDWDSVTDEQIKAMDATMPGGSPSICFVVNTVACLIAGMVIGYVTGCTPTIRFPKRVRFDYANMKMTIEDCYSIGGLLRRGLRHLKAR